MNRVLEDVTSKLSTGLQPGSVELAVNSMLRMIGHCNCSSSKNIGVVVKEVCDEVRSRSHLVSCYTYCKG